MWRCARVAAFVGAVVLALAPMTRAQEPAAQSSEPPTPQPEGGQSPPVAEFIGPIGSVFLPGFGQFLQGDIVRGTVYQGVFLAGWTMSRAALNGGRVSISDFRTFDGRTEWGVWAQQLRGTAGSISAYDAFRRALPALQKPGRYAFVRESDSIASVMRAPIHVTFLKDPLTYLPIALIAVTSFARRVAGPSAGREFASTPGHDIAFAAALAYNAGIGEEMVFRGYLMPVLQQHLGDRAWLANGLQALAFAADHGEFSPSAFAAHAGYGLYAGFVVQRNRGSLRQAVFNHFVWDLIAVSGAFLTRQRDRTRAQLSLPVMTVTF